MTRKIVLIQRNNGEKKYYNFDSKDNNKRFEFYIDIRTTHKVII